MGVPFRAKGERGPRPLGLQHCDPARFSIDRSERPAVGLPITSARFQCFCRRAARSHGGRLGSRADRRMFSVPGRSVCAETRRAGPAVGRAARRLRTVPSVLLMERHGSVQAAGSGIAAAAGRAGYASRAGPCGGNGSSAASSVAPHASGPSFRVPGLRQASNWAKTGVLQKRRHPATGQDAGHGLAGPGRSAVRGIGPSR